MFMLVLTMIAAQITILFLCNLMISCMVRKDAMQGLHVESAAPEIDSLKGQATYLKY